MLNLLLSLLLFLSFPRLIFAYEDRRWEHCGSTTSTKYKANSTFATNLDQAFNILKNNTAFANFNSTTYTSNGTDPVTALALCRGDLNPSECQPCIEAATAEILEICPKHSSAEIWYNLCMIRYSGQNFLTQPDSTTRTEIWDTREVAEPDIYNRKVQELSQNLSISVGKSDKKFAGGWTRVSSTLTLYGYQACSRDLSSENCTGCLTVARNTIESCCLGKWAGWILTPSCELRFNMDPVYNKSSIFAPEIFTYDLVSRVVNDGNGNGRSWGLIFGVTVGVFMVVILVIGSLWLWVVKGKIEKKKKKKKMMMMMNMMMERRVSRDEEEGGDGETSIIDVVGSGSFLFDFEVLVTATENFSLTNRLGSGGFGTVYKGMMTNGYEIAVKKLAVGSNQGVEEFSNEVVLLLRMQHRNLVMLLGCCVQGEEKMLVYEYLRNKSLDIFIFDKSKSALLDWPKRLNVIIGIARGLLYLHEDSQLRIVHRDIKASNILLDEQMMPKISDFGLARLFPDELSQLRTRRIAGTIGYMAPEYAVRGLLSAKSDVFSFGVLILEIISGRRNYDAQLEEQNQVLLNLTWRLEREGRLMELLDVTTGSVSQPEVLKCMQIGLLCCQENIQDRPIMSSVLLMLSNDSVTTPLPGRPAYQGSRDNTNQTFINSDGVNSSMTMTLVSGR